MKSSLPFLEYPKILIIEDDEDIRDLCRMRLEAEDFSVATSADGGEALKFLDHHQRPCLILLDMMMPIMDGREFMSALAKSPHTIAPIPVYLVSATANSRDGEELGCLGFLKKPVNFDALLTIVRTHCKTNGMIAADPLIATRKGQASTDQIRTLRRFDWKSWL